MGVAYSEHGSVSAGVESSLPMLKVALMMLALMVAVEANHERYVAVHTA